MTTAAHLWAIGYDDMARAEKVREEIIDPGWGAGMAGKYLLTLRRPAGADQCIIQADAQTGVLGTGRGERGAEVVARRCGVCSWPSWSAPACCS
jgi:hypothetical protein